MGENGVEEPCASDSTRREESPTTDLSKLGVSETLTEEDLLRRRLELEKELIEMKQERELRTVKQEYAEAAQSLALKHRTEARELEAKWRDLYVSSAAAKARRMQISEISAQFLDDCRSFKQISQISGNGDTAKCCTAFEKQFRIMLERHAAEFDQLHGAARNRVLMVRQGSGKSTPNAKRKAPVARRK
jgi:hypothetical protein